MRQCRYTISRLLCALLVLLGAGACSGDDCPINNTVMGKMTFYDQHDDAVSIIRLSVSAVRPQGDSVVLNMKPNASEVLFPLSYVHETDTFVLEYDGGVAYDSIFISHTNTPMLISVDCGTAMFHSITSVSSTHNLIDTLVIKSSEVNYDERENIKVVCH